METDKLLSKYFGGNASSEELQKLEAWIAESPENEAEFMRLTRVFELSGSVPLTDNPKFNTTTAKQNFTDYMENSKTKKHVMLNSNKRLRYFLSAAAAVAILVVSSIMVTQNISEQNNTLTSDNQTIDTRLSDGIRVQLSAQSQLSYKNSFRKSNEDIWLNGKARFDVGNTGKGQLRVFAGNTIIEDIGTVFEVTAFDNSDYIQVKVSQGMVKFYTESDKGIILNAFETGIFNKKTNTFKIAAKLGSNNQPNAIELNLDGITLNQAIEIIENAYNINITLADKYYANEQITVTFANENAETVLNILGQTLGLKVEKNGGNFVLKN